MKTSTLQWNHILKFLPSSVHDYSIIMCLNTSSITFWNLEYSASPLDSIKLELLDIYVHLQLFPMRWKPFFKHYIDHFHILNTVISPKLILLIFIFFFPTPTPSKLLSFFNQSDYVPTVYYTYQCNYSAAPKKGGRQSKGMLYINLLIRSPDIMLSKLKKEMLWD